MPWRQTAILSALDQILGNGHVTPMLIYKIFHPSELAELIKAGTTKGAPIDRADGYVHFSTGDQIENTLALHFKDALDLSVLAVEADNLGDALKWEPSRGGALFPHLYRELRLDDVLWHRSLTRTEKTNKFPRIWA
jgi:uncharacterized protein (DUF952 family)